MNIKLSYLILVFILLISKTGWTQSPPKKEILPPDYQQHFDKYGLKGSFIAYDMKANRCFLYDEERVQKRFTPASTFKIFNSLVGLETGVIPDTSYIIPWDSVQRGTYPAWHRANSLKSAFKYSVVWYYQELARRVGEQEMQHFLNLNEYGNMDTGGGVDLFWLSDGGGQLRISQAEQIEFLKKLYREELSFSKRNQQLVKGIMLMEQNDEYKLYAKTGLGSHDEICYGWYVGWVEKGEEVYFFATNLEASDYKTLMTGGRQGVTMAILQEIGFLEHKNN